MIYCRPVYIAAAADRDDLRLRPEGVMVPHDEETVDLGLFTQIEDGSIREQRGWAVISINQVLEIYHVLPAVVGIEINHCTELTIVPSEKVRDAGHRYRCRLSHQILGAVLDLHGHAKCATVHAFPIGGKAAIFIIVPRSVAEVGDVDASDGHILPKVNLDPATTKCLKVRGKVAVNQTCAKCRRG